jgi:hypothetical protein
MAAGAPHEMYNDQQINGYNWLPNGRFNGDYTPTTNPSHLDTLSKSYKYIITASYGGNIFAKFSEEYEKQQKLYD